MNRKEIDIYHVKIEQSSKSKRKEISRKKALGKEEEVKKIWEEDKNRPDHIRKRVENYLSEIIKCIEEVYPKEKRSFEEIFAYSEERAREEIAKYEKISPERRKEELNLEEFLKNRFREKEKTTDQNERTYKTIGFYRWFFLLNKAYKEDLEYIFSVDGFGKTRLDKIISAVRQEITPRKR